MEKLLFKDAKSANWIVQKNVKFVSKVFLRKTEFALTNSINAFGLMLREEMPIQTAHNVSSEAKLAAISVVLLIKIGLTKLLENVEVIPCLVKARNQRLTKINAHIKNLYQNRNNARKISRQKYLNSKKITRKMISVLTFHMLIMLAKTLNAQDGVL